ncbi:MAG: hypothetical protein JST20_12750 [Bacteroidetes bacterium]|nr:hypothetical protein [Bacteroidota bacterium]
MIKLITVFGILVGILIHTSSAQTPVQSSPPVSKAVIKPITRPYSFPEIQVGVGLVTSWLNGANSASDIIFPKDTVHSIGGGFNGQQPGIALRGIFIMDADRRFRITTGLDYIWYTGLQRIEGPGYTFYARHTLEIPTVILGFEYAFLTLPLANAKIYAGVDARYSFVTDGSFRRRVVYKNFDKIDDTTIASKPYYGNQAYPQFETQSRLGASLKLGIEGELLDPVYVNISGSYGAINLVGRNDIRGELLTPSKEVAETQESVLGNIFFTMMLQYRF